ncbi:DNA adenine methylase [Pseudomonas syringae pv. papulans]|nr:DNA adenine methylase [Pseudomonas syringae pv. papulans]
MSDWLISNLPDHRVYVEPFSGAASVLLKKPRSTVEVINDKCSEITNLFSVVRDRGSELQRQLELTPYSRDEFDLSYQASDDPLERARRLVVRASLGRSSASSSKSAKATFRAYTGIKRKSAVQDWVNYPAALEAIISRLKGVIIENKDALGVMSSHDHTDTVHYVDPPYLSSTRDAGGDYRFEMSDAEHESLGSFLANLKGMVVLSGYESDLYNDLYRGWRKVRKKTHADGAVGRVEVMWLSPNCISHAPVDMFG